MYLWVLYSAFTYTVYKSGRILHTGPLVMASELQWILMATRAPPAERKADFHYNCDKALVFSLPMIIFNGDDATGEGAKTTRDKRWATGHHSGPPLMTLHLLRSHSKTAYTDVDPHVWHRQRSSNLPHPWSSNTLIWYKDIYTQFKTQRGFSRIHVGHN